MSLSANLQEIVIFVEVLGRTAYLRALLNLVGEAGGLQGEQKTSEQFAASVR